MTTVDEGTAFSLRIENATSLTFVLETLFDRPALGEESALAKYAATRDPSLCALSIAGIDAGYGEMMAFCAGTTVAFFLNSKCTCCRMWLSSRPRTEPEDVCFCFFSRTHLHQTTRTAPPRRSGSRTTAAGWSA